MISPFVSDKIVGWFLPDPCSCQSAVKEQENLQKAEEKKNRRIEAIKRFEKIEKLFKMSRMGQRFRDRTFDNFKVTKDTQKAFKTSLEYANNFNEFRKTGVGLFFTGPVGTGKTHLAASIAQHLINELTPVIFGNVTTLLGRIRETYSSGSQESEHEIMDSLINADLLIIDDLGKEQTTDWVLEKLYTIINARYEDCKPLIVTTNLSVNDLEDKIGDAAVSRIIEMCDGVWMGGIDFRKKKLSR